MAGNRRLDASGFSQRATRVQATRHNVVVRTALILVNFFNFNMPRVQRGFYAMAINYASLSLLVGLLRSRSERVSRWITALVASHDETDLRCWFFPSRSKSELY